MNQDVINTLWVQKYRPQKLDDVIAPESVKQVLRGFVEQGDIPNLILAGSPGNGKTTTAKILAKQLQYETIFINASLENGIDVVRNKIASFASSISLTGSKKCVILDESDFLSPAAQPSLRGFIEQFSKYVRFIFTCNYSNRLIEPLKSRCTIIEFGNGTSQEKKHLMQQAARRLCYILKSENVQFQPKAVAQVLSRFYPDIRRCINQLQRYSASGSIDQTILNHFNHDNFAVLVQYLREKNFKQMRNWVAVNKDVDSEKMFRYFYDNCSNFLKPDSVPQLILTTAQYQYKSVFVADQQINNASYLTEIMSMCHFI